jgi:diguanylate cyclase (GGDEF)-like protein
LSPAPPMETSQSRSERRRAPWVLVGGAAVALIGLADYATGQDLNFAIFYLIPIAVVSWRASRGTGILVALISTMAWFAAERLGGRVYSNPLIPYWNAWVRLCIFVAIGYLIGTLVEQLENEKRLARTDPLTGALNSRAFREVAEMELNRARRYGHAVTLAYVDVDDFKAVNDRLGHSAGDGLLRTVAETMRAQVRATDSVARIGGDEFVVLLPETGPESAKAALAKVQQRLADAAAHPRVTFSIGCVTFVDPPDAVDSAIRLADELMYTVKRAGKNSVRHTAWAAPANPGQTAAAARP